MILAFHRIFIKEFERVPSYVKVKVLDFFELVNVSESLDGLTGVTRLTGYENYYRYRVGDYRIGLCVGVDDKVRVCNVLTIKPRGKIYKSFP